VSLKTFCQEIKNEVLLLGSMVEEAVMDSARALKDNDLHCSNQVVLNDIHINRKRYGIERMADYAKEIANINIRSKGLDMPAIMKDIYSMAEKTMEMLHRAMTTFADEDMQSAQNIILEDDVIDECYTELYHQAVKNMLGDPRNIDCVNYVIWVAHNLERLGDRVTNICERVIYIVTGEHPEADNILKEFRLLPHEN